MITNPYEFHSDVCRAAEYIKSQITDGIIPKICIVLGSGLSPLATMAEEITSISYYSIPNFPHSTAPGHEGRLIVANLEGKRVFMMSGRFHYYEGYDTSFATMYVRVMSKLGVETLFLTNAAGGIGEEMNPAELMVITDHISFFCESPLRGPNVEEFGVRFPDQTEVYDRTYASKLIELADANGITVHDGIYAFCKGPQYETPAEIQALKMLGASAVGMSTVPEAIVASHCGMKVAAVSCITNLAAGISPSKLTHEEVLENAGKASANSCNLVKLFINSL